MYFDCLGLTTAIMKGIFTRTQIYSYEYKCSQHSKVSFELYSSRKLLAPMRLKLSTYMQYCCTHMTDSRVLKLMGVKN